MKAWINSWLDRTAQRHQEEKKVLDVKLDRLALTPTSPVGPEFRYICGSLYLGWRMEALIPLLFIRYHWRKMVKP